MVSLNRAATSFIGGQ